MSTILDVQDLNVYYGVIHALKGISFHVDKGEIVTLIGANGAGKTTTLQTITGLIPARSGHVFYNGKEIIHRAIRWSVRDSPMYRRAGVYLHSFRSIRT